MSNIASHHETLECNCVQHLDGNSIDFTEQNDNNNNNIIINSKDITNNNTIIIINNTNFDLNSHESVKCEKAVQTIPEIKTAKDFLVDKTTNMEKDRNDSINFPFKSKVNKPSNFKNVQSNEDDVIAIEELQASCSDINLRANNENGTKSPIGNNAIMPQNLSVSDERYEDKNVALNYSALDSSQIVQVLNHSKWNKTFINTFLATLPSSMSICAKGSQSKTEEPVIDMPERSSNKSALKQILDQMDTEIDVFTQTENVRKDDKDTQTEPGANSAKPSIKAELSDALQEFLRKGKIYFDEFQNKLQFLFSQNLNQNTMQKENIYEEKYLNEAENTFSSGSNEKVEKAAADKQVRREGVIENNVVARGPVGSSGSNINPSERQRPLGEEQTPAMQLPVPSAGNQPGAVRAGRPRNEQANARYSPYPRQQFWQGENNNRQRQAPYVQDYHQMNGMHLQHNAMVRPFNGWQAPNPPNHQAYFCQQHHQQHHF